MAQKRTIDCKIRSSQSYARLNYRQRDLWHGLIETVDDQGRMPGEITYIRSMVWPFDDIPLKDVDGDLSVLVKEEMVKIYEICGNKYLQIINWWKYQGGSWMGISNHPAPEGWTDRYRFHGKDNKIITRNWLELGGFNDSCLPANSKVVSDQVSPLPCHDDDDDVNDEGNADGDTNDDADANNCSSISFPSVWKEYTQKVTTDADWQPLMAIHAIPGDLKTALDELMASGRKLPRSPDRCVESVGYVVKQRAAKCDDDDYRKYIRGKYAAVVQH